MINDFIETQLAIWPEAKARYLELGKTERRPFCIGDFRGCFQHNPARIVSTGASVSKTDIDRRPCFLCRENRPENQIGIPVEGGFELLLNPFPIFPVHFTIAACSHVDQEAPPLEMASIADAYPELAVFFNGSRAGASAPDHLHMQAVLKTELPIIRLAEDCHRSSMPGIMDSVEFGLDLPFRFLSAVISANKDGASVLRRILSATGLNSAGEPDGGLRNVIFWKDDAGMLRAIVVPRRAHRPSCYGSEPGRMLVSPGTIDMAGIVILPRRVDFDSITDDKLREIYSETALGSKNF